MSVDQPTLAAVVFESGQPVDSVIRDALSPWSGHRILGWLQGYEVDDSCSCDDIVLTAIHDGSRRKITQNLGRESQGCRLDPSALAEVAGWLATDLTETPDLLVLNRFGKIEAEGAGLRSVLESALTAGVPVLVPVNRKQLGFWQDYAGDMAATLACEEVAIRNWIGDALSQPPRS